MDHDESQPTQQATQNVVDPRRLGKQNSGFSDDDISDIICLLLPYSEAARQEVADIALSTSQHMVRREDADNVDLNCSAEVNARGFGTSPYTSGEHAVVLRLSAQVKNPLQGFTFGRNSTRCDICFTKDPLRRLSNIHFRIYLNEYGVLMLEDQSTNGTVVDGTLLKFRSRQTNETRRTLSSGSIISILMHEVSLDLAFLVRIPKREGDYEALYRRKMRSYLNNLQFLAAGQAETMKPGPTGHVDLFPATEQAGDIGAARLRLESGDQVHQGDRGVERFPREWTGSEKYNRVGQIGKGAFATVYKVTSKFTGTPYAAKELDKRKFMKNGVLDQKVENEMTIMQNVQHPNIVQYIEHLDFDNRLFIIIMEYVPGGDLGRLISESGPLPESVVKQMSSQLLDALGYLHEKNITHRDVKPDNILIQSHEPFKVKLTDFGLSKMVDNEQTFLRTFCGTLLYCAPEVYTEYAEYDEYGRRHPRNRRRHQALGQRYGHAVDIWSLGGVLFYALTGSPPYPARTGISYTELLNQIMTRDLDISPLVGVHVTTNGIDFLSQMLNRRPEHRATVRSLQAHTWLVGPGVLQPPLSPDEISDDGLGKKASQLSLGGDESLERISESGDEIIEDDVVSEDLLEDYDSQKENYTFGHMAQPQRLFGEVNVSAIGSSGVIPANRLNLPISAVSSDLTNMLTGSEIPDSYESGNLSTSGQQKRTQHTQSGDAASALGQSKTVDELNNMTFDMSSQSLGGAESILEGLNMKSLVPTNFHYAVQNSFTASKRKPSFGTSEEFDTERDAFSGKPNLKRLKSETQVGSVVDVGEEDHYSLYASVPPVSRLQSGRQIDTPVNKSRYWDAQDRKTWHLRYPEMTQLQHDAFRSAAETRGEVFAPGRSPLWELAMRHFPPTRLPVAGVERSASPLLDAADNPASKGGDAYTPEREDLAPPPPTLGPNDAEYLAESQRQDTQIILPIRTDLTRNGIVASLQSAAGSVVQGISVPVEQSLTSWGRALDNTNVYTPKTEAKVPKYALKLILWKEGYDPSKNFRPWNNVATSLDDFHFYISTKATNGIQINGTIVPSHEPKNPSSVAKNWVRVYDGDIITVWGAGDDSKQTTRLIFRCNWGGSSRPRPSAVVRPSLVPGHIAKRLDEATIRAERRMGGLAERESRIEEADAEFHERLKNIERERERSRVFEQKRFQACRILAMKASRRNSPAGGPPVALSPGGDSTTQPSVVAAGGNSLSAPVMDGVRSVPAFRHAEPSTEALRAMAEQS
ncbi:Serine/threonine-protein kinase RAD53 [Pleurostoma richardsiae]|uniref:Autophagy-related protein 1 n=1 Tax=Pleurostoma richardsiae TaxID=41990 RepID=A0AA38R578_9PEZI|nr:Serine/threonine-protein kinase RAD53 [Pleurostoma richardsiae]